MMKAWLVNDIHLEPYSKEEVAFLEATWANGDTLKMRFLVDQAGGNDESIVVNVPKDLPMSKLKRVLL